MFTIKYLYAHGNELIDGPFDNVTSSWVDKDGQSYDHVAAAKMAPEDHPPMYRVVIATSHDAGKDLIMGPNIASDPNERPSSQAVVYVMNENGATVAKYLL